MILSEELKNDEEKNQKEKKEEILITSYQKYMEENEVSKKIDTSTIGQEKNGNWNNPCVIM